VSGVAGEAVSVDGRAETKGLFALLHSGVATEWVRITERLKFTLIEEGWIASMRDDVVGDRGGGRASVKLTGPAQRLG